MTPNDKKELIEDTLIFLNKYYKELSTEFTYNTGDWWEYITIQYTIDVTIDITDIINPIELIKCIVHALGLVI